MTRSSRALAGAVIGVVATLMGMTAANSAGSPPPRDVQYEGNTDQTLLALTRQAAALPEVGHAWRNAGPYGGVVDLPAIGSGYEKFGPVSGIGTALAVDPSDPTGNTVYLGTIGGLYKSTDGGHTIRNIVDGQLARVAIGAVAVDPHDPSTVYAGTGVSQFTMSDDAAGAGVYVSHDRGRTWTRPASNTHGYGTNAITVLTSGAVLVGTNYGLWRSVDHGASFQRVAIPTNADHTAPSPHPLGNWMTTIAVNPSHPQEVTVGVGYAFGKAPLPGSGVVAPGNGLYRSTNDGATFAYLPSSAGLTWSGASADPVGRISLAYSTAPGGQGLMWALVGDAGKTAGTSGCLPVPLLGALCHDGGSGLNGLYRSADDGATWHLEATALTLATALGGTTSALGWTTAYAAGVQADYNNWVLADPVDPNRVYIGLEEAFTGEYPAMTWTAVEKYADLCGFYTYPNTVPGLSGVSCPSAVPFYGSTTTHPDQHSAVFARTPGGFRLYSGNDGGWWAQDAHPVIDTTGVLYEGFENGSWRSISQLPTVLPWDVAMLQDGSILLALQDNGAARVRPDGSSYQVCAGDGTYIFPGANSNSYYCAIDGQQILATTDDAAHVVNETPANNATVTSFLSPFTVDAGDPNHLMAAAGNVDESTQGPNTNTWDPTNTQLLNSTWQTVFTPPAPPHDTWDASALSTHGTVSYVAFCSRCRTSLLNGIDASHVVPKIATNVQPGCKAAELSSACWHLAASRGLPHQQIGGIALDPSDPRTIYVALRNLTVLGTDPSVTGAPKVMVSHDGGETFTDLTGNLPRADAHRIALRDGQLYVATDVGVFTSAAGGNRWSRLGSGLPQVTFRSMKLDLTGRYLVLGAYGRGGWVYDFGAPAAR